MYKSRPMTWKNCLGLLLAVFLPLLAWQFWKIDFSAPHSIAGDDLLGNMLYKSVVQYGLKGVWFCPSLGAPEMAKLIDTPFMSYTTVLKVLVCSWFTSNIYTITYINYALSFMLSGMTMYLLLNRLIDRIWIKTFFSIAFAITPYHFLRGMVHLTLSNYYPMPMAIYLMLLICSEEFKGIAPARYMKQKWKIALMYFCCIYLGISNIYYAFFGLFCMAVGLLIKLVEKKKLSVLWKEAVPLYVLLVGVVLTILPGKLYTVLRLSSLPSAENLLFLPHFQILLSPCG